jgi:hypothetical protein
LGETVDPLRGGGEQDSVAGLARPDRDPDGEVGLAGAGRTEEHDVLAGFDEVEGAEMGDDIAFEGSLVVEVELLEGLSTTRLKSAAVSPRRATPPCPARCHPRRRGGERSRRLSSSAGDA